MSPVPGQNGSLLHLLFLLTSPFFHIPGKWFHLLCHLPIYLLPGRRLFLPGLKHPFLTGHFHFQPGNRHPLLSGSALQKDDFPPGSGWLFRKHFYFHLPLPEWHTHSLQLFSVHIHLLYRLCTRFPYNRILRSHKLQKQPDGFLRNLPVPVLLPGHRHLPLKVWAFQCIPQGVFPAFHGSRLPAV